MPPKILVLFAACLGALPAPSEGAPSSGGEHARVREQRMDSGFHADWMRSDGAGGVYVGDGFRIHRFDSTGHTDDFRMPHVFSGSDSPAERIFIGPDGMLWLRDDRLGTLRYAKGEGWEAVPLPDSVPLLPSPAARELPPDAWALGGEGADTLGLFLASSRPDDWRRAVFTVGPITGPPDRRDTLPFPSDWAGPHSGRRPMGFDRKSAFLVSRPEGTWIALGGLLALKRGPAWTVFYSQDQSLAHPKEPHPKEPHPKEPYPKKTYPKESYPKERVHAQKAGLSYRLTRPLPYLYTVFLAASAMQTGPGWVEESAWTFGGIALGSLMGAGAGCLYWGMCAAPNASCGSGMAALYPLIAVPLVAGIWALESHVSAKHEDRKWTRRGAAGLGALSGAALYFAFPTESGWVITGALAGASFGAVAGYRLAWLP